MLRFGPILGTLPPTHLVDHVLSGAREPGLAVHGSHIRHLFLPRTLRIVFSLSRQTHSRWRRTHLFLGSRQGPSCRSRLLIVGTPFALPGLRLCSQTRSQCPTHRHTLAIGCYHQQFLLFFGRRNRFTAKALDVLGHLSIHVLCRANTNRRPQPSTQRLHRLPKSFMDAQSL